MYICYAESLTTPRNITLDFTSLSISWPWLWWQQSRGLSTKHWLNSVHRTAPSEHGTDARHTILHCQQAESKNYKDLQLSEYCWFIDKTGIKLYDISTIHSPSTPVAGCNISEDTAIGDRNWRSSAKLSDQYWIRITSSFLPMTSFLFVTWDFVSYLETWHLGNLIRSTTSRFTDPFKKNYKN